MTDTSATQGLLRTTSTDDPRRVATYLQGLAEGVDRKMATHAYNQKRARQRPFACLQVNTWIDFDANNIPDEVPFDTVAEDTDGMADLSADNFSITLTRAGFWCFGAYVQCTGFGAAASDTTFTVRAGSSSYAVGVVRDGAIALAAMSMSSLARITVPNTSAVTLNMSWAGASTTDTTTIRFAQMWAYWVRDL